MKHLLQLQAIKQHFEEVKPLLQDRLDSRGPNGEEVHVAIDAIDLILSEVSLPITNEEIADIVVKENKNKKN